jgi:hypothetical protein
MVPRPGAASTRRVVDGACKEGHERGGGGDGRGEGSVRERGAGDGAAGGGFKKQQQFSRILKKNIKPTYLVLIYGFSNMNKSRIVVFILFYS